MDKHDTKRSFRRAGNSVFSPFPRDKKQWLRFALFEAVFALCFCVLCFTGIGCVYRFFIRIPCPGCGMTRAYLSLLRGDVAGAFRYHFMFPFMPFAFLLVLYDGRLFRKDQGNAAFFLFLIVGFLIRWILNLTGVLPA